MIYIKVFESFLNDNFKNWFGDSKVVNKDGTPMVMYHGTHNDFDKFLYGSKLQMTQSERGHYTGYSNQFGTHFGTSSTSGVFSGEDGSIMPVYLKIKNPLRVPDLGMWDAYHIFVHLIKDLGWDELRDLDERDLYKMDVLQNVLESKGYDGFIYKNYLEGGGTDSYVIFNPNQVKSALGNNGNFSPKSDNINESK